VLASASLLSVRDGTYTDRTSALDLQLLAGVFHCTCTDLVLNTVCHRQRRQACVHCVGKTLDYK